MVRTLAILFLSIAACSDGEQASYMAVNHTEVTASAPAESEGERDSYFCGGETDVATVQRFFSDLEKALAQPGPAKRFNRFVGTQLTVTTNHGRPIYFNVEDLGSVTPGRITIEEWQEIHRRGERSLHGAGYRGCFMDHGKVWFEASEKHGFRLAGIAKNMPWVPFADGDSVRRWTLRTTAPLIRANVRFRPIADIAAAG